MQLHRGGNAAGLVGLALAGVMCLLALAPTEALYPEEAGVIDWRKQYVGAAKSAVFTNAGKYLVVATDANAVAALNARSGELAWRQVLPDADSIDLMVADGEAVYIVSGEGSTIQQWDARQGFSRWAASVYPAPIVPPTSTQLPVRADATADSWFNGVDAIVASNHNLLAMASDTLTMRKSQTGEELWSVALGANDTAAFYGVGESDGKAVVVGVSTGDAKFIVQRRSLQSGEVAEENSYALPFASAEDATGCRVVGGVVLACLEGRNLHSLPLNGGSASVITLAGAGLSAFGPSPAGSAAVVITNAVASSVFRLVDARLVAVEGLVGITAVGFADFEGATVAIGVTYPEQTKELTYSFVDVSTGSAIAVAEKSSMPASSLSQAPTRCFGYLFRRSSDDAIGFTLALRSADEALVGIRKGAVIWTREESLSAVTSAVFADLPPANIVAQDAGLQALVGDNDDLLRDYFNNKKIILAATKAGKLHAIMSEGGKDLWSYFPAGLTAAVVSSRVYRIRPAYHANPMVLFLIQTTTGWQAHELNPLNGQAYSSVELPYNVKLVTETPVHEEDGALILSILDTEGGLHIFPETATAHAALEQHTQPMYMFTIDEVAGRLQGYKTVVADGAATARPMWHVQFNAEVESIAAVASRHAKAKVNSVGETLGDRSVIYKYLNPNMLALATMSPYARGSANMTIYLIDTIKGAIITRATHTGVFGAVHLTQSANWVVYHYRNRKAKRNEIGILELFSGDDEPPEGGFTSFEASPPAVLRQAYIAPFAVSALATTITEQGVTETQLLAAKTDGSILGIQKKLVDSRRPKNAKAAKHAEGLTPYHPVLGLPPMANLNHKLALTGVHTIYSSPCGLESTTTVLATGLDLYMTQIAPSKKFDALSDDFPQTLLVACLVGLSSAVYVIQSRGKEKKLKRLWK